MDRDTMELVKFIAALIIPALVGLMTLLFSNRHARKQAGAEREHQAGLSREAAARAATAQRYDERREAYSRLVNVAVKLRDEASQRGYEGEDAPENFLDGPELAEHFSPLNEALNDVLLIGTSKTREAAEQLSKHVHSYVWSQDGYRELDRAMILFREAARVDLGIEESGTDKPVDLPPNPRKASKPE